jgi:hypothetical protein
MKPEDIRAMLDRDEAEWRALVRVLDSRPDGPLHGPAAPAWTVRDVYAHLARWITLSTDTLEALAQGRPVPTPPEGDDDEINARWHREDSGLTLEEARSRARSAYERRLRVIESIPAGQWDPRLWVTANADGWEHYAAHRRSVK